MTPSTAPDTQREHRNPELSPDHDLVAYLDRMLLAAQAGDDATSRRMTQTLADHLSVDEMRREVVATVDRWEELERQQQTEQQQASERRGPVMRM